MFTKASGAQRSTTVGAVLALFFSLLMFASPAQAAIGVDISTTTPSVEVGDTITLNWTSTDAIDLVASGAWSGLKAAPNGTENITATAAGSFTYTLLATDADGREATDSVTVTVTEPAPAGVTPNPVTFPGECIVEVPETEGIKYTVTLDGETSDVDPGTYDGYEFLGDEDEATFEAVALDGFVIADGATKTWSYDAFADCFGDIGNDELVEIEAECSAVTVTNIADLSVDVAYGDMDEEEADGEFTLAEGASRTFETDRSSLFLVAFNEDEELVQFEEVDVPQNCGADPDDSDPDTAWPVKHPTRAPAAGVVAGNGGSSLPVAALLSALALIAVRRSYALGQ